MENTKNIFATRWGIIAVGALIGALAALLQKLGNPGNMGICVACFDRDTTGAVYGQLAGAFYGEQGIPESWRNILAHRKLIECLAEQILALGPKHIER